MTNALYPKAVLGPNSGYVNQLAPVAGNLLPNAFNAQSTYGYAFDLASRLANGLPLGYGGSIVGEGGAFPNFLPTRVGRRYGVFAFFSQEIFGPRGARRMAAASNPRLDAVNAVKSKRSASK